jgi:hypothetical protein
MDLEITETHGFVLAASLRMEALGMTRELI